MVVTLTDKTPILYEKIAEEGEYDRLPSTWTKTNLKKFSDDISLFDYQQDAIRNAIKLLHHYFDTVIKYQVSEKEDEIIKRKKEWYKELVSENSMLGNLGYSNKNHNMLFEKIEEYYETKQTGDEKLIEFFNLVNRMGFWMATGSGKTIILIKLIEILTNLKDAKLIPDNDILILAPRTDLVNQIKDSVKEFNKKSTKKIGVWNLNEFEEVKNGSVLLADINIFISESHLISEETKENQLGFGDFENDGKWYVLLDEAHKGDTSESKRQLYYSLMSRNGFLFNFSATFTDDIDILTTVSNFNLESFIQKGYGKNVYLSNQQNNITNTRNEVKEEERGKNVLKSLILLSIAKDSKIKINKTASETYHNPMLVALVNSVNTETADLKIFFRELGKIAEDNIDKKIFADAKKDLIEEFGSKTEYNFGNEKLKLDKTKVNNVSLTSIRKNIFNSSSPGKIEVITIPENHQEIIFRVASKNEGPFAMIKMGDTRPWIRGELWDYEKNDSLSNESYFKSINNEHDGINILMGSRSFYEGWDTNRPNVMLFINIGVGDAKKYLMQSIGRGVRIKPFGFERKRLVKLKNAGDSEAKTIFAKLNEEDISIIETLFVLGTDGANVEDILNSIKYQNNIESDVIKLQKNKTIKQKDIMIPIYKKQKEKLKINEFPNFPGNKDELQKYVKWLKDDRLIYAHYSDDVDLTMDQILQVKNYLKKGKFGGQVEKNTYSQFKDLMVHTNVSFENLDKFTQLKEEISHFEKIVVTLEESDKDELDEKIEKVKNFKDTEKEKEELKMKMNDGKITLDEYTEEILELNNHSSKEDIRINNNKIHIKHIQNHYYSPVITSEKEKIDYIKHIINVPSEVEFLEQIEEFIDSGNERLDEFEWSFSKIDEHLDKVHIPYYSTKDNEYHKFYPDFIFWLKKDKEYFIIFVDPKGTSHSDYEFKIDGYSRIFEKKKGNQKTFEENEIKIKCYLYLYNPQLHVGENYKGYWVDSFDKMIEKFLKDQK
jgi:type III restriction enzyme